MAKTDTSERWFEARVVRSLTGVPQPEYSHELAPTDFAATHNGYVQGKPTDYNRDVALDVTQLLAFLQSTQPKAVDTLELAADGIKRTQFLHRLQGEITKRGVVDVLRKGLATAPYTSISTSCYPRRATQQQQTPSARTSSALPDRYATATNPATS